MKISLEDRFWTKVAKADGCWLWTAHINRWGYGVIRSGRKVLRAHRVSWEMKNGPISNGLIVCHKCDTPACVRPDHLFLGTVADNMRDRNAKRRHAHNERHARAKLTEADVKSIRAERAGSLKTPVKMLAKRYGVHHATVCRAASGQFWTLKTDGG